MRKITFEEYKERIEKINEMHRKAFELVESSIDTTRKNYYFDKSFKFAKKFFNEESKVSEEEFNKYKVEDIFFNITEDDAKKYGMSIPTTEEECWEYFNRLCIDEDGYLDFRYAYGYDEEDYCYCFGEDGYYYMPDEDEVRENINFYGAFSLDIEVIAQSIIDTLEYECKYDEQERE